MGRSEHPTELEEAQIMTLAIVLNAVFVTLLLTFLAATMRLPFLLRAEESIERAEERIEARLRQRRARHARRAATTGRPAIRGTQGHYASD
jgi:NhaP-type Na+/H+ or K+/H+ antiporter